MKLATLDFETYYSKTYSLSKMTTEAYVRDPQFQAILLSIKIDDGPVRTLQGPAAIRLGLMALKPKLEQAAVLMHHAHFDGLILSHHYGIQPKRILDTLSMARALHGAKGGNSLAKLAERYGIGAKGTEIVNALGLRHEQFDDAALARYVEYCEQDVNLTYKLFVDHLMPIFPAEELRVIDLLVRMYTDPVLRLRSDDLLAWVDDLQAHKATLIERCGVTKDELMSNPKFAAALENLGVEPPTKISPTTGKETFAFAKTDDGMQALQEHEDTRVQVLVEARLGNKSTINQTRAIRMAQAGQRGAAPIYLNYSGAGTTHRTSGGDKLNYQNLGRPARITPGDIGRTINTPAGITTVQGLANEQVTTPLGVFKVKACHLFGLRDAIEAPEGYKLVVVDSANIEARVLDTLAGQSDAVQRYREKADPYLHLASSIYGKPLNKVEHARERQLGKVAKLGLGYGMGAAKFLVTAHNWGIDIDEAMAAQTVSVYRTTHHKIVALWKRADDALRYIAAGQTIAIDEMGLVKTTEGGIMLPNGLVIKYPDLRRDADGWTYWDGHARVKIYGGKVVENIVQALARNIVVGQMLEAAKRWRVSHFVHDELVLVVPEDQAQEALEDTLRVMQSSPSWWPMVPLDAEGVIGVNYGNCK